MRKLMKKQGFRAEMVVTDKLRSYGAAFRHLRVTCPHGQGLRQNNRAENSHQPGTTTRAQNAAVQISGFCAAISQYACRCGPQYIQSSTASCLALNAPDLPIRGGKPMAGCGRGGVIAHPASGLSCSPQVKLTMPSSRSPEWRSPPAQMETGKWGAICRCSNRSRQQPWRRAAGNPVHVG